MFRRLIPVVALILAAGPLVAQPPTPARPTVPIIVRLLPFVSDENFGKALDLTPEQVKALTAFRRKQWDEQYTTPADKYAEGAADHNKATAELFRKTLTAEQHKRAMQLATQMVLSSRFSRGGFPGGEDARIDPTRVAAAALNQFPELAAPLNLTAEQKKLVEARVSGPVSAAPVVFLTAEQAKALKGMTGEPVNLNWNSAFDERMFRTLRGGSYGGAPGLLGLTEAKDVRAELALTAEQTKTLADIAAKWSAPTRADRTDRTQSPEARAKALEGRQAEAEKAVAAALKPEQLTRLKQISMQTNGGIGVGGFGGRGGRFGGPVEPPPLSVRLNSPEIRKALAVTDAQVKAFADADKAQADATEKAVLADGPVDDAIKAIDAAHTAREKAYEAAATTDQKKKLDDLLGKPFTGSTVPDRVGGGGGGRQSPTLQNMRAATFGKRVLVELRLLASNKAIQDDLGLKPEQLKAVTAKAEEATTKFGPGVRPTQELAALEKSMTEQSEYVAKALADILTAEQVRRFRELMIQRAEFLANRSRAGGFNPSAGAVSVPGVAEAVKLTAEQKKKLLDEGVEQEKVLTAEQKATIHELAGKKYDGTFVVGPGGRGFVGPGPRTTWPVTATVLREVPVGVFRITPEQADKLAAALNRYQLDTLTEPPTQVEGGGFRTTRVDPAKLSAANDALTKALAATLSAEQLARVEQVKYQAVAQSAGMSLLAHPDVVKALALTKEQTDKHAALVADAQRLTSAAGLPFALANVGGGFGFTPWAEKFTEKMAAKATALLTDEQKATWKRLTGDPVPNLPRNLTSPAFGGGFGGF